MMLQVRGDPTPIRRATPHKNPQFVHFLIQIKKQTSAKIG
jgi:hypothetical protein